MFKGLNGLLSSTAKRIFTPASRPVSKMTSRPETAGIVVIGDEIIKGQVQDSNSHYICSRLHHLGVTVCAIITLPDHKQSIADYVSKFSQAYDYVITSGGIGPTHDDITYEAIALSLKEDVKLSAELDSLVRGYFKEKYTPAHQKLAMIPKSSTLIYNQKAFPVVSVNNIYILPGVPQFLKLTFSIMEETVIKPAQKFCIKTLHLKCDEMSIAAQLTEVSKAHSKSVTIGSYPEYHNSYYRVRLVFESVDSEAVENCMDDIVKKLPSDCFIQYDDKPLENSAEKIEKYITSSECPPALKIKIENTMSVLKEAIERYGDNICIGFNGGKDCTAILHLWYTALQQTDKSKDKIRALYIRSRTPFPEVETFIEQSINRYNVDMMRYDGTIKEQLQQMVEEHHDIEAVIMGTRATDPHGSILTPFIMTDPGWPQLMRVNPILNWSYSDIWMFLRSLSLNYCQLYDVGYTSLGSMENTHPNPALRYTDSNHVVHYKPAYLLTGDSDKLERAGRTTIQPSKH